MSFNNLKFNYDETEFTAEQRHFRVKFPCGYSSQYPHQDYCNFLYRGLSEFNLHKLQCLQNNTVRIVTNTSRFIRSSPVLRALHWLPVEQNLVLGLLHLFTSSSTVGFPNILGVVTISSILVKMVLICLWFPYFLFTIKSL